MQKELRKGLSSINGKKIYNSVLYSGVQEIETLLPYWKGVTPWIFGSNWMAGLSGDKKFYLASDEWETGKTYSQGLWLSRLHWSISGCSSIANFLLETCNLFSVCTRCFMLPSGRTFSGLWQQRFRHVCVSN